MKSLIITLFAYATLLHAEKQQIPFYYDAKVDSMRSIQVIQPVEALKIGFQILQTTPRHPVSQTIAMTRKSLGNILNIQGFSSQALEYYVKALNDYVFLDDSIAVGWMYIEIGNVYFHRGFFKDAEEKYQKAFQVFKKIDLQTGVATVLNNLALISLERSELDSASNYFLQSLKERIQLDNPLLIAHSYLYLGEIYLIRDSVQIAQNYFYKAQEIGITADTLNLIGRSHESLGEVFLQMNQDSIAMGHFRLAESDFIINTNVVYLVHLYQRLAAYYVTKDKNDSALVNLNRAVFLAEKHNLSKDKMIILEQLIHLQKKAGNRDELISLYEELDSLRIGFYQSEKKQVLFKSEIQLELSAQNRKLAEKEARLRITRRERNFSVIAGLFLALFIWLLYRRFKQNKMIHLQELKIERLKAKQREDKIVIMKKELVIKATYIQQKSDLIGLITKDLKYNISLLKSSEDRRQFNQLVLSLEETQKSEDHWQEFEKQFTATYPGYFKILVIQNSSLTTMDLKMCAYLKMNMNTKEIASLTGLSVRSIESRRFRLRKKLGLNNGRNLFNYFNSLDNSNN
ncbi:MAG: tetratricopeptide repeat protein [Candidatus Marinimicrobia bacterium]|nr:tetratricopeptide repeat protein [Candidatus Neomarinimicrobiota bacterium]